MRKIIYKTNDYCFAIYDEDTKKLLIWGQHGDDPVYLLARLGKKMGFSVSHAELENLDGSAPKNKLD
jgi:hypothetical protein